MNFFKRLFAQKATKEEHDFLNEQALQSVTLLLTALEILKNIAAQQKQRLNAVAGALVAHLDGKPVLHFKTQAEAEAFLKTLTDVDLQPASLVTDPEAN